MAKSSTAKKHATCCTGELDSPPTPRQSAEPGMGILETPTCGASVEVIEKTEFFDSNKLGKNPNEKTVDESIASMEVTGEHETENLADPDAEHLQYVEHKLCDL
ncbi:hypothetical protein H4R20_001087, partial [Coemansia guatemalensis]